MPGTAHAGVPATAITEPEDTTNPSQGYTMDQEDAHTIDEIGRCINDSEEEANNEADKQPPTKRLRKDPADAWQHDAAAADDEDHQKTLQEDAKQQHDARGRADEAEHDARGTADTQMPGTRHADVPATAITGPQDTTNPPQDHTMDEEDMLTMEQQALLTAGSVMTNEEEQMLESPGDNTTQLKDEEEQSTGRKKPLSDKDKEKMAFNRCTGLVKAILIGKNRWIQLKHKGIEIFREYQAKTRILSDLLDQHPTVGVKLIAHKQAGETGLVKPAEWLVQTLTNDQAPASQADRARNGRQRTPASSNEHNNTPRQHWE